MGTDPARVALLQQMAVFGGIRADALAFLLEQSRSVSVPRDAYFFRQGDQAEAMYVLEAGRVAVVKDARGVAVVLRELGPGDCFGEMALMDMSPRSASVVAIDDCCAIEVPMAGLMQLYQRDLEQFTLIEMNLGREISRRLREADERLMRGE
jgi:CRP-like cAMP-binding protein